MKFANETEKLKDILTQFKSETPKRTVWGQYRIEGKSLLYRTTETHTRHRVETLKEFHEWRKDNELKGFSVRGERIDIEEVKRRIKLGCIRDISGHRNVCDEIARKVTDNGTTLILGNSSILKYIGRSSAYGNVRNNRHVTGIQKAMSADSTFMMIPFTVFEQAGLDINKFKQIEKLKEEKVILKEKVREYNHRTDKYEDKIKEEERHFTGASLFSVDSALYLFDIDRGEIKHGIFNPFLATIPVKVKTVKEAYEALKPNEVKTAEKHKLKVMRQGEWFFIPTKAPKMRKLSKIEKLTVLAGMADSWESREAYKAMGLSQTEMEAESAKLRNGLPRQMNLQAGNSRPNTVDLCMVAGGKTYCTGKVKHTGREHKDLELKGWYLAVPNTSIANFTVTGDVD